MPRTVARALALSVFAVTLACRSADEDPPPADAAGPNQLTAAERETGWRLLFDGNTTAGWRGFRQDSMPAGWQVVDGTLTRVGQGGDIITVDQFTDFELSLEWRVDSAGNSGIFYRATEEVDPIYEGAPEMQVLDDAAHADGGSRLTSSGALYGLYPAPEGVVRPAGEWNSARIVVHGTHVEHWLNGTKIVECELWSPDFTARVADSKFAPWPQFARAATGHIGLQDHGDRVAFRNIKLRELP